MMGLWSSTSCFTRTARIRLGSEVAVWLKMSQSSLFMMGLSNQ